MNSITDNQIAGVIAWRLSPPIDVDQYRNLLKLVGEPGRVFDNLSILSDLPRFSAKLQAPANRREVKDLIASWNAQGIKILVYGEPEYPEELTQISDPPLLLTYRGNWSQFGATRISIVGSRRADREGIEIAQHFAHAIVAGGSCVVSGLALGIDGAAHRGALMAAPMLDKFAPTIAILGNGLSQIYPRTHAPLAKEILDSGGLIMSQFDPHEPAYPVNFLNRNRLIAALSLGTLVIQASDKSGSLVTARYALEFGKELFIIPGSIKDPRYAGSNRMLKHGAHLITTLEDIGEICPQIISKESCRSDALTITNECRWLMELLLESDTVALDYLHQSAPEPEKFYQQLLLLELDGLITRLPGNQIALSTRTRLEISNSPA